MMAIRFTKSYDPGANDLVSILPFTGLIDRLFTVLRPAQEFFHLDGDATIAVKDCKI
jgi:hypothetical protein